ncbi:MAG: hypothetical protein SV375_10910, partial [Thermodesulfobacteriota bacterium]|nr:hypothetical protein [Thermodesulfobacteriota bacterium]
DGALQRYNHPHLTATEVFSHTLSKESAKKISNDRPKSNFSDIEWLKQTLKKHPFTFVRNCILRVIAFFSPVTFTITKDKGFLANLVGILVYFPLLVLSVAGVARASMQRNWAGLQLLSLLAFFMIPHVLLISNTRYRIPWDTIIICFAVYYITDKYRQPLDKLEKRLPFKGIAKYYWG